MSNLLYNLKLKMKIKGRNLIYILEGIKEEMDAIQVYKELHTKYKELLPEESFKIKEDDIFPFEVYLSLLEIVASKKGKEFIRNLGKIEGKSFISQELRIAKRMDIDWVLDKALLICESFFVGCKCSANKISENEARVKIEGFDMFNEFVEEEIKGFIEGVFEEMGIKIKINILSSPLSGFPFLEFEIKW